MKDTTCVTFLQSTLPRLGMRWPGFRKVRRQVCKRINRRLQELNLEGLTAYQGYLLANADEWRVLDRMCRITISRFYRDKGVFRSLAEEVLPTLLRRLAKRGKREIRCWSAGCSSGEEPYSLALLWELQLQSQSACSLEILASDADPTLLERARRGCYGQGSVRELPHPLLARGFLRKRGSYCLRPEIRERVEFLCQDIREEAPPGPFHLILCRNLVFTYFDEELQGQILATLHRLLLPGGALVIGSHESLPDTGLFSPWPHVTMVYQRE